MEIESDNPEHGFQFPGMFEVCAMGPAQSGLEQSLPRMLREAGIEVLDGALTAKQSSSGKYVSVRIGFLAASREHYERAHQVLREHPDVKWTL
jgi:putative lipoic acid-binding regulatory protein